MRWRVTIGRFLVRFGRFVQSLAVSIMRPGDLVQFSRQTYARSRNIEGWGDGDYIDSGLDRGEKELFEKVSLRKGTILVLGLGGGREAISFARMGYDVTGIDFISGMIRKAVENAAENNVHISGLVQEISQLDMPENSFDIIWLSSAMYSCVPTRKRRIMMLKRIEKTLKPGGYFICQFHWDRSSIFSPGVEFVRRAFALLTLGNLWYERGDMLWNNVEFIHTFGSKEDLLSEFKDGGLEVIDLHIPGEGIRGGAIMRKEECKTT